MFHKFIKSITKALQPPLPGEQAQRIMAPNARPLIKESQKSNPKPKLSAVLILIYPILTEPHIILILRSIYQGVHSGQVGLPGGKKEMIDGSLRDTAMREAEEETGVGRNDITLIGELSELYISQSGFLVHPFVGYTEKTPVFVPDIKEVKQLIEVPISTMMDDRLVKQTTIRLKSREVTVKTPYFDIYSHVVWGATAMILSELKEVIKKSEFSTSC